MKLLYLVPTLVLHLSCGGSSFTAEPLSLSTTDDAGDAGAEPISPAPANDAGDASAPALPDVSPATRDVLADPWPADVTVEPVCKWGSAEGCPCVNCWLLPGPEIRCCGAFTKPNDSTPASQLLSDVCGPGDYPTPNKAYCDTCACHR